MKKAALVILGLLIFSFPVRAAGVVVGADCDQLGASMMTTDQQNIAVCLKNTSGKLVWKATTSASGGSACGLAVLAPRIYYANCTTGHESSWGPLVNQDHIPMNITPCEGKDIFSNIKATQYYGYQYDKACPSGYAMQRSSSVPTGSLTAVCNGSPAGLYITFFYCKENGS